MPPSTAAVNALMPSEEADVELVRSKVMMYSSAGAAGHEAAEQEREHDDAVDVDAHERGRLEVLGDGPDAATEPGAAHELVEGDHHDDRADDDDDLVDADVGVEEREDDVLLEDAGPPATADEVVGRSGRLGRRTPARNERAPMAEMRTARRGAFALAAAAGRRRARARRPVSAENAIDSGDQARAA